MALRRYRVCFSTGNGTAVTSGICLECELQAMPQSVNRRSAQGPEKESPWAPGWEGAQATSLMGALEGGFGSW